MPENPTKKDWVNRTDLGSKQYLRSGELCKEVLTADEYRITEKVGLSEEERNEKGNGLP